MTRNLIMLFTMLMPLFLVAQQSDGAITDADSDRYTAISEAVDGDQSMSDPFADLQEQGVTICSSADGAVRTFSWETEQKQGHRHYNTVIQYRVARGVARQTPLRGYFQASYFDFFESYRIEKIHNFYRGIYLLEGSFITPDDNRGSALFAYDLSSGILKKSFLFRADSLNLNHISFHQSTAGSGSEAPLAKFGIEEEKLFVPTVDSTGQFSGGYETLYYNFGFFETEQAHKERIATSEKGKFYISRIVIKDGDNLEAISDFLVGNNLSIIVNLSHRNDDNPQVTERDKIDLTFNFDDEDFAGAPVLEIAKIPLIDGVGYVENMDITSLCEEIVKSRKQKLWSWAKPQRVLDVAGLDCAVPYQYLRYTAVRFTRKPSERECRSIRWVLEVDGERQLLDKEEFSGTQIELMMQPHWAGKTIRVTPYIKKIKLSAGIETAVEE